MTEPHDPPELEPLAPLEESHPDDPDPDAGVIYHPDEQEPEELPPEPVPLGFVRAPGPPTLFSPPFACPTSDIGSYRPTTYPGHSSFSLDMNAVDGRDIGDPVLASADGVVFHWEPGNGDMRIRHPDGRQSWYVHMQKPLVGVGDRVKRGQRIASLGNAGIGSTGPHLHVNHADDRGKQIKVVWDGKPVSISVSPNTQHRAGSLIRGHCPEEDMRVLIRVVEIDSKLIAPAGSELLLLKYDPATDRETGRRTLDIATPVRFAVDRMIVIDRDPKGPPYGTFYRVKGPVIGSTGPQAGEWIGQRQGVIVTPVPVPTPQPTPEQRKAILAPVRTALEKAEAGG